MASAPTQVWNGKSGTSYTYWIYPIGTSMADVDGNYIYAYRYKSEDGTRYWKPVYIGEGNLKDRSYLGSDYRGRCIKNNKATHFHAHRNEDEAKRLDEETDLRARFSTPCNRQ